MPDGGPITILPVRSPQDILVIKTLFQSYACSLPIDLSFQDFETELRSLPGKYSPHAKGELLLARSANGNPIGCVCLRALTDGCCEMKRLYISPTTRGLGLGRKLVREIMDVAEKMGYGEMRLDTLPSMVEARGLYKEMGFVEMEGYYDTPVEGTVFLRKGIEGKIKANGMAE